MKITKAVVKRFEKEQEDWGTDVALKNVIWLLASEIFKGIGVTRITTSYRKVKKGNIVIEGKK